MIKAFDVKLSNDSNSNNNSYWFEYSARFVSDGYNDIESFVKQMIVGDDGVSYKGDYKREKGQSRLLMEINDN